MANHRHPVRQQDAIKRETADQLRDLNYEHTRLVDAVKRRRADRYGEPPRGPFYSVDAALYKAAGL